MQKIVVCGLTFNFYCLIFLYCGYSWGTSMILLLSQCPSMGPKLCGCCCAVEVTLKGENLSGSSRGSGVTGHTPAGHHWGDGMASVALSCFGQWVCSFQIIPKNAVDAASRTRKAQDLPRHRLACAVAQAKIRAHWECKERRMREAGNISKCCLRKVLKCGRTKPLGLFVKGNFSSPQIWGTCAGWTPPLNPELILWY